MKPEPAFSLAEMIPHVCTITDVCRLLRMSRTTFYRLQATNGLPFGEILPRIHGGARFRGVDVQLWIEGHYAAGPRRVAR
jgi:hypothetical protein